MIERLGTLQQAKTLGGVGSILGLLSIVPYAGPVLSIVGFIMVLIAVKYISTVLGNKSIFNNMIISVILAIVGIIVGVATVVAAIFSFVGIGFLRGGLSGAFNPSTLPPGDLLKLGATIVGGLVVVWIFFLISAIFIRRSYNAIAERLGVGMFHTAALLYLIGAALIIALGLGFIVLFVASILTIVAFFSIPDQLPQPMQPSQTPMAPTGPPMVPPAQTP